ncbi:mite allergen Der f 3-like [Phlebotomus argentipes]|uniref:mite allergen Der f 3-like n=1 Tax=Phlebotomus argentipes TaxID=94469 RepID=UPI002892B462|nr:mite allergen Der f 3-like [Phlebotomus argentipes]
MTPEEPQSRIIGGKPAEDGQFPFFVRLVAYGGPWSETRIHSCGGSIIDPRWVLTAGHCLLETTNASEPVTYHIEAGSIKAREPRQFQIVINDHAFLHPDYNPTTIDNDIALIKIKPFTFDKYVHPVRIALGSWNSESYVGETITAMGFGYTSNDGPVSPDLLWTQDLTVISREECAPVYFYLPSTVFCGVDENGPPISSVCSGDSGGPAVIFRKGKKGKKLFEIGLVSFGSSEGCDTAPQAFTDIAQFHDWLTLTMARNS